MTGDIERAASPFDAIKHLDERGEYWSAREVAKESGYREFRNFEQCITSARQAIAELQDDVSAAQHIDVLDHEYETGIGAKRTLADYRLTRYGAYMALGFSSKPELKHYFAVRTAEAEAAERASLVLGDPLDELERTNERLGQAIAIAKSERARAETAEAQRDELAPDAHAWQTLASADGDLAVADAAKVLTRDPNIKVGRDRLFTVLNGLGWTYRQRGDGRWRAVQAKAIDTGRLSELPSSHYHPRTGDLILDPPQVRVTVKGLRELHQHLGGTAPLHLEQQLAFPQGAAA